MDICVWGPRGSGKTWLIDSFIHQVNNVQTKLKENESQFDIEIRDILGKLVYCSDLEPRATMDIDYSAFTVARRFLPKDHSYHEECIKHACENVHELSILDSPGDIITGEILTHAHSAKDEAEVMAGRAKIKSAKYLIVVINSVVRSEEQTHNPSETFSVNLRRLVNLTRDQRQKVFLCFTKIDENLGPNASLDTMLPLLFGNSSNEVASLLRELISSQQSDIKNYFVSAPGYYYNANNEMIPNIENGRLINKNEWEPHGVCKLFFDIFDDCERESLSRLDRTLPTKLPGKILNKVFTELAQAQIKDIQESHISYHEMR